MLSASSAQWAEWARLCKSPTGPYCHIGQQMSQIFTGGDANSWPIVASHVGKTRKVPGKRTLQGRHGYIFVNTDCLGLYNDRQKQVSFDSLRIFRRYETAQPASISLLGSAPWPRSSGISPRSPRPDPQRQLPPNHASAPPFEARKAFAVLNLKARRRF